MKFKFTALVVLSLENGSGKGPSKHLSTDLNLEVSDNLVRSHYIGANELPNEAGSKVLSNVLVQGLVANIHQAHINGFEDSAAHLRWIIAELERGFASVATVKKSTF